MTLIAQWSAASSATGNPTASSPANEFQQRTCMAAVKAAVDIGNEVSGTPNHVNRVALAKQVLNNPWQWMGPFTFALAAESLTNESTDSDISNMIAAVWNPMAGAS